MALNNKVEGCKPKDMIGIPWFVKGRKPRDEDMDFFDDEGYEEEPYINEDEEPQIAEDAETDGDED